MKIYLDSCCYNRPFDDFSQERVYLESQAVLFILEKGRLGEIEIVGSDALDFELDRIKDTERKFSVINLYKSASIHIALSDNIEVRSCQIREQSKIRFFDSLQIAFAEAACADVMLTTDDKLEKMASKIQLDIRVMNPLEFILEFMIGSEPSGTD